MNNLHKLWALTAVEFGFLLLAIFVLPIVAILLKMLDFGDATKLLARLRRKSKSGTRSSETVAKAAHMVTVAAGHGLYRALCLEQAISLWWILGLVGIDSTIRFGVVKSGDTVEAHAWVLYQGELVIGQTQRLHEYTPMFDVGVNRTPTQRTFD